MNHCQNQTLAVPFLIGKSRLGSQSESDPESDNK